eukprot:TsM_000372900 transcript=TsM_000372900 gene=TsM_000372900
MQVAWIRCFIAQQRGIGYSKHLADWVPRHRLMTENECLALGSEHPYGWELCTIHQPEPHIILFRWPRTNVLVTTEDAPFDSNPAYT